MSGNQMIAASYKKLDQQGQIRLLGSIAHSLTIDARETYIPGTEGIADPVRLRGMNELQHQIAGQLLSLLNADGNRYPDDVFVEMLLNRLDELRCPYARKQLENAIQVKIVSKENVRKLRLQAARKLKNGKSPLHFR